ncbi:hypothetical protein HWQ46_05140 [Shewanella sp. D64]|uniref:hypothetical protein n=1 Tax=unclassified Shewanella TaxID=196818 RepID=UPI0022BA66CA|nr:MULTISPECIES: hypothetical protein [unclassified Shewanella]MEC4724936.1 hypothetical protein [Shewanella sp. D64]MEC4736271.1 hypothetical protein [Shewanella sp. E94]WBJ97665.1 hypothetical protein HWQ47_11510 [Shewanella sp. MTB7]
MYNVILSNSFIIIITTILSFSLIAADTNVSGVGNLDMSETIDESIYLDMYNSQVKHNLEMSRLNQKIELAKLNNILKKELKSSNDSTPKVGNQEQTVNNNNVCPSVLFRLKTGSSGNQSLVGFEHNGKVELIKANTRFNGCILK